MQNIYANNQSRINSGRGKAVFGTAIPPNNNALPISLQENNPSRKGTISQYASSLISFSTEYGNPNWSASNVLGGPRCYPRYGDMKEAWAPAGYNSLEHVSVGYVTPVIPKQLQVYETYTPGAITNVFGRLGNGAEWVLLANFERDETICTKNQARIFNIDINYKSFIDQIKIELDCRPTQTFAWPNWSEIDAICLIGQLKKKTTKSSKLIKVFEEALFTDINFQIGDETVKAHRALLVEFSMFEKMFNSNMQESQYNSTVDISGVEPYIFREMIRFVYTGSISFNEDRESRMHPLNLAIPLFVCADRYTVAPLRAICLEELEDALTVEESFNILRQAKNVDIKDLYDVVISFMADNYNKVFQHEELSTLSHDDLLAVCKNIGNKNGNKN